MPNATQPDYQTPFETGNQNQSTTLGQCIAFYQRLAQDFPAVLQLFQIGVSDGGVPIHAGVVTADGVLDREQLKRAGRPVFFNNNGIHPGEPEGIDACMALVRDFCIDPARRAQLLDTVFLFIAAYNVDGCLNRGNTSRVNQVGPEQFGFRANTRNLDLNRDFIKCDTLEAQAFNRFFCAWDPEVMVDTHTSNGADYAYTMTLIHTETDKLGAGLGDFLRETMLPAIYAQMDTRGWPTCPYVHPVIESPDQGIEHMLDSARFSTGYAALHHTIGFMPETHMLKPFADRYAATRALVETVLQLAVDHGKHIQALRQRARDDGQVAKRWPVLWRIDYERPALFRFKGFRAVHQPSTLGHYLRLAYDRSQPWEHDIAVYQRCAVVTTVAAPRAYLIPQAWREVAARLQWNGVHLQRITADEAIPARVYQVDSVTSRATPYEGRLFHDAVVVSTLQTTVEARVGDYLVALDQPRARYAVETLEPMAHDSFFRWGFFNSILEKKERFSAYLFEDIASEMLQAEPELQRSFAQWKADHPQLLADQNAVLDFLFAHGQRFQEPSWKRYPVAALV